MSFPLVMPRNWRGKLRLCIKYATIITTSGHEVDLKCHGQSVVKGGHDSGLPFAVKQAKQDLG